MIPKLATLRFSKGFVFCEVFTKGYKKTGIFVFRNNYLVSGCTARHYMSAKTLQILYEIYCVKLLLSSNGYTDMTSCNNMATVPTLCHRYIAIFGKESLRLASS
mmetsp:Transcript_1417/g.1296  ORF Transcript_1417/g.1296 Transcript_1417/m.1296 type:complete len:104 (+) Transcript_1417:738-1049(+)